MISRASSDPPDAGCLQGNLFLRTGQNPRYDNGEPYCFQTAIARHAAPDAFSMAGNLFLGNREAGGTKGSGDLEAETFLTRARPVLTQLATWPSLRESSLLARLGRASLGPADDGQTTRPAGSRDAIR
jgi:hypothetical protein